MKLNVDVWYRWLFEWICMQLFKRVCNERTIPKSKSAFNTGPNLQFNLLTLQFKEIIYCINNLYGINSAKIWHLFQQLGYNNFGSQCSIVHSFLLQMAHVFGIILESWARQFHTHIWLWSCMWFCFENWWLWMCLSLHMQGLVFGGLL